MADKYNATWVSHSSINDFLNCPRLYYLRHVYKDPRTNNKLQVMNPYLALGLAVHDIVESLSVLPTEERLTVPLTKKYESNWKNYSGKKGGFRSKSEEQEFYDRGYAMLERVQNNPGPITNKAVKITREDFPPHYWLSEDDEIMISGKIDWLEYLPDTDTVHIIDFKTGRTEEKEDSLQLPIYLLLATNTQKRGVERASYWYLDRDDAPIEMELPEISKAYDDVMKVAKRVKLARQLEHFKCPRDGCKHCLPYEDILKGKGELIGNSSYQDIYIIPDHTQAEEKML